MIELVDTHTHLNDAKFDGQEKEVIERARAAGVTRLINMGDTLVSSEKAVKLAETYDGVFAGVGIHPEEAIEMTAREDDILAAWTELPGVVAIGEIGLDYYWEKDPDKRQLQQRLAVEVKRVGGDACLCVEQTHDGHHRDRFARPRFAHDAQHLARIHRQAHAFNRMEATLCGAECNRQIFYFKQGHADASLFMRHV